MSAAASLSLDLRIHRFHTVYCYSILHLSHSLSCQLYEKRYEMTRAPSNVKPRPPPCGGPFGLTSCTWGRCAQPATMTSGMPASKGPARLVVSVRSPEPLVLKGLQGLLQGIPLGLVSVFSGELQVLGEKSSVASVILGNVHLYGLTPVGAFFLLLLEVCPALIPDSDGPMPLVFTT